MERLKNKILEFSETAKSLPENLQVVCFELLLKHHLGLTSQAKGATEGITEKDKAEKNNERPIIEKSIENEVKSQDDITPADVHVKAKRFLSMNALSVEDLNNLFYKEGPDILPLYEDLRTTRLAECQIRIALLHALHNAIKTGGFEAAVEDIRQECKARKCYDQNNFSGNFKNNKEIFDFTTFDRETKTLRLTEKGKNELAEVIKELK